MIHNDIKTGPSLFVLVFLPILLCIHLPLLALLLNAITSPKELSFWSEKLDSLNYAQSFL